MTARCAVSSYTGATLWPRRVYSPLVFLGVWSDRGHGRVVGRLGPVFTLVTALSCCRSVRFRIPYPPPQKAPGSPGAFAHSGACGACVSFGSTVPAAPRPAVPASRADPSRDPPVLSDRPSPAAAVPRDSSSASSSMTSPGAFFVLLGGSRFLVRYACPYTERRLCANCARLWLSAGMRS